MALWLWRRGLEQTLLLLCLSQFKVELACFDHRWAPWNPQFFTVVSECSLLSLQILTKISPSSLCSQCVSVPLLESLLCCNPSAWLKHTLQIAFHRRNGNLASPRGFEKDFCKEHRNCWVVTCDRSSTKLAKILLFFMVNTPSFYFFFFC